MALSRSQMICEEVQGASPLRGGGTPHPGPHPSENRYKWSEANRVRQMEGGAQMTSA